MAYIDIAFPTERNNRNDFGVLDRLLKSLKEEAEGHRGGMSNKELHKRVLELEPLQSECLHLKEKLAEIKEKADLLENELRETVKKNETQNTKITKMQTEYDQNLTQLGYDVEHYKNMYDELKEQMNKTDL